MCKVNTIRVGITPMQPKKFRSTYIKASDSSPTLTADYIMGTFSEETEVNAEMIS